MKYYKTGFVILILTAVSCNPFGTDVYSVVKDAYNDSVETIDFSEVMGFEWDTMYWFPMNIPLEEVNSIVNINSFWQDIGDRIVFVKDKRIVYYQEFFPCSEVPLKRICFDPNSIHIISREDALFLVRRVSDKLFVLSIIQNN